MVCADLIRTGAGFGRTRYPSARLCRKVIFYRAEFGRSGKNAESFESKATPFGKGVLGFGKDLQGSGKGLKQLEKACTERQKVCSLFPGLSAFPEKMQPFQKVLRGF